MRPVHMLFIKTQERLNMTILRSLFFLFLCVSAQAQMGSDVGEFGAYVGTTSGSIGSNVAVGGGSFLDLGQYVLMGVEATYMSTGDRTLRPYPDTFALRSSRLYDFNLTGHIRIPPKSASVQPYGLLSIGFQHATFENLEGVEPNVVWVRNSTDNFAFATGGGVRYYIRENWGLRPEVRVVISTRTYMRYTVGVFAELASPEWALPRNLGRWFNPLR